MSKLVWGLTIAAVLNYAVLIWLMVFDLAPASGGLKPLDIRVFGYSYDEVLTYLDALRFETAAMLTGPVRWIDTSFPVLFALSGVGWIWISSATRGLPIRLGAMVFPVAYGLFDLIENVYIGRILMGAFPSETLVSTASLLTISKFACVVLSFAALFLVLDNEAEE
jgi:hypothetical protein